ncbi:MAG: DUF3307 domain-containing protein [Duncaniella sp.]|nr:DUF3307 domain-containing protein [Duncaniella sp.]
MIIILIKLIAAHLIGDFIFQTDRLCDMKYSANICKRTFGLSIHSGIQAVFSYIFIAQWTLWIIPAIVFASHFIIDFVKVSCNGKKLPALIADQLAHYTILVGLWWLIVNEGWMDIHPTHRTLILWAILTSYIAVLKPTSILIKSFIEFEGWIPNAPRLSDTQSQQNLESGQTTQTEPSLRGLPNAGKWIGYLERILILTFIYTGNVEGIGFLLAAKSVFRFGELNRTRDIKITEYVLIGTFVSFTIAIIIGFGVKWLIGA